MQKQEMERLAIPAIKTVLVPLDGSAVAEDVLPYVKMICGAFQATPHLLSIADPGLDDAIAARPDTKPLVEQMETHASRYLEKMSADFKSARLVPQTSVKAGSAGDIIVNTAKEINASLIAMSTHGRSGVSRMVYGSVADRVIHDIGSVPIFMVRPPASGDKPAAAPSQLKNVIMPLDGSKLGEASLPYAVAMARKMNLTVHLIQVVNTAQLTAWGDPTLSGAPTGIASVELMSSIEDAAKEYISDTAAALESAGVKTVQKVLIGSATWQIVSYAHKMENSFVSMTTHGRTGLKRAIMGSIADGVLRESGEPVLMIPSKR